MADPTINARPSITPSAGFTSKWNAGGGDLPIQYQIQNTKFPTNSEDDLETFSSVNDDNGYAKLIMSSYPANVMVADDYVTVAGTTSYNGVWKVKSKDVNDLTIDAPYVADESGTAIKYYRNYRTQINVYAGINTDHPYTASDPIALIGTIEQKPGSDNLTKVDIHKFVKRQLVSQNDLSQASMPNDLNGWTDFYITYREIYDEAGAEVEGTLTDDSGNFVGHAVNSALQFQNQYGGNMYQYVMSDQQDIEADWLTFFEVGYHIPPRSWDVSLIHDSGEFTVEVKQYDENSTELKVDYFYYSGDGRGLYRIRASLITFESTALTFTLQVVDSYTQFSSIYTVELGNVCLLRIPPGPITPDELPITLTVYASTLSALILQWNDNSFEETGFEIYRSTTDGFIPSGTDLIATVAAGVTNYTDTGLGLDTYYYKVRATDGSTFSDYSNQDGLSTVQYDTFTDISAQFSRPSGVAFNGDGTSIFVCDVTSGQGRIYEYSLSTPYDIGSTVEFVQSKDLSAQNTLLTGFTWNDDGTKLFTVDTQLTDQINEYSVASPYDIGSTVNFVATKNIQTETNFPTGVSFNTDGTLMFVSDANNNSILEYTLLIGFDLTSTVSYTNNLVLSIPAYDIQWNSDGTLMYVALRSISRIRTYSVSIAFDITSTLVSISEYDVSDRGSTLSGICFNPLHTRLEVVDDNVGKIFQYNPESVAL